jgi:CheY-like chemotaxis protein
VEDNQDVADTLSELLTLSGYRVVIADDGRRAIELARSGAFSLVVCDIGLPGGLSGLDVARWLRSHQPTRDAGLVALTGYGRPRDAKESTRAGFDVHLTKPVDFATLQSVLAGLRERRPGEPGSASETKMS